MGGFIFFVGRASGLKPVAKNFLGPLYKQMATVGRANSASVANTARLSYISTAVFNDYFYSYSTSLNASLETIRTLGSVSGATSGNCPKGRVLRETGRKLYPGANPGITTYLVGVYDAVSMLTGFIDPNGKVFQIYNTDKPNFYGDGVEPTEDTRDLGPSVYTRGDILAEGAMDISGGATIYGGETVKTGDLTVTAGNLTLSGTSATLTLSGTSATVDLPDQICGTSSMTGSGFTKTVSGVTCTSSSKIFLQGSGTGSLRVTSKGSGSFVVTSSFNNDGQSFDYLIIN